MSRAPHLVVRDTAVAEADVVGDRAREQMHVLEHEAEHAAQLREIELADVDAVNRDPPSLNVVEPKQQIDQRRLAGAGRADDAHAFTGSNFEADVSENPVLVQTLHR